MKEDAAAARPYPVSDSRTEGLYLEHAPVMRRIAIRKFGVPPADADTLVHDVFVNYLMMTRAIRADLRTYLIGAICNACRNYWRSQRTEGRVFSDADVATIDVAADKMLDGLEDHLTVASILAGLGERCREVLRRYYLEGEDTATIAAAMDTTSSNVNYMMHICRKRAREAYEKAQHQ